MPKVQLRLFGPPRLEVNGVPIALETRKTMALLAYLVMSQTEQSRESLAALLWPEQNEQNARANLRRALWSLSAMAW